MRRVGKAKRAHASIVVPAKTRVGTAKDALLPTLHAPPRAAAKFSTCRGFQDGNRTRRRAFYTARKRNKHRVRSMKEELTTILEAMRAAHGELADYLVSGDRNAELTIAKLVGILERREVVRAMRSLRALEGPGAPQLALAEAS